jgi:hypothetical protein
MFITGRFFKRCAAFHEVLKLHVRKTKLPKIPRSPGIIRSLDSFASLSMKQRSQKIIFREINALKRLIRLLLLNIVLYIFPM